MLGISIIRDRGSRKLQLSQSQYLADVLIRFKMEECKSISTPMFANQKLYKGTRLGVESDIIDRLPYQQLVGSLMYAMVGTRPDLAYAVGILAQHMQEPRRHLWQQPRESFGISNQPRIYISPFKQEQDIKVISSQGTVMQTGQAMKKPGNQHQDISSH